MTTDPGTTPPTRLAAQLTANLRGEVRFDGGTRALYAADASNYRHAPLGVVVPADEDDVATALSICAEHGAPVLARGAGTSLAGQACNEAVVLDTSRRLDAIVELDPDRRLARVQPGVVLDRLRDAAGAHGLTFGPDPATHAWCTLGGMAGNNSCGTHGLTAGRTSDNVERLRVVTAAGTRLDLGPLDAPGEAAAVAAGGELARIVTGLRRIADHYGQAVRDGFPRLERRVSGFNLDELLPEHGFHLARALVGTESTCAVTTELTVSLVPLLPHRRLVLLAYPDVFAAADAVPGLRAAPLAALEGFDDVLVGHARAARLNLAELALLPPGGAYLLAEVAGDTEAEAMQRARDVVAAADGATDRRLVERLDEQQALWRIRESGLGATARPPGRRPNLEGWEDAAVPPERLGEYLRGITELWGRYGYHGAWYGHFGQGCVHTRNDFDLSSAAGVAAYRSYVEQAADLCVRLGGSLSGEHGDGQARGELLVKMFGPELVEAFGAFKAVFDPDGRMNPGRVVHARPLDADLRHGPDAHPVRLGRTRLALRADGGDLAHAAERCVGVGRCRNTVGGVMCPSYRATRDERHSTRGRAKLLGEMFRGELTPASWRNEDVFEALSLCLSCKGCAVDCPTHVDMGSYKSEFLSHYYHRRRRPTVDYVLSLLPLWVRIAGVAPRLANALGRSRRIGVALRRAAGLSTARAVPELAPVPFRRSTTSRARSQLAGATVAVFADTFSDAFLPRRAEATVAVLEAAGERVVVVGQDACCGRTLFDSGMLDLARANLRRLVATLGPAVAAGLPVVVPEPSCLATLRDELGELLPDDPGAGRLQQLARSLGEHLVATGLPAALAPPAGADHEPAAAAVFTHCHQRATGSRTADRDVLVSAGFDVTTLDPGCCGLAGSFGFRAETDPVSRAVAETGFAPALRALPAGTRLVLDGFSCALQAGELGLDAGVTLAELLAERLGAAPEAAPEAARQG